MNPTTLTIHAPGRINLIGEHTDYNGGFVLPAAIDKHVLLELESNGSDSVCNLKALTLNESFTYDLTHQTPSPQGWQKYVVGIIEELRKRGAVLKGFDATFKGNVPLGSGMSSSAALENSFAFGLNELFQLGFDRMELVKVSQLAEHNYVGTKCGIMDQFTSMFGQEEQVILLDCRSLEYEYLPLSLGDYELLLLNTNVSHSLADSEYNTRRAECEAGIATIQKKYPTVQLLRDVSMDMLNEHKDQLSETIYRRCAYVIQENERVLLAKAALQNGQLQELGNLMYASHQGLSKEYEVSCKELDYLVEYTKDKHFILGSRMMGGGFGGCTISIVRKDRRDAFVDEVAPFYQQKFGRVLSAYSVNIGQGVHLR